jgi:FkbM family methyltransferase
MNGAIKNIVKQLIGYFTKKLNGPHVESLIVQTENGLFSVAQDDLTVGWKLRRNGQYGSEELQWLKPYLTPESRVLVVGAHIGSLAIPISKICKEVVAIEANPDTFKLLSQNILLNQATNCTAINIAASDKTETISFLLNKVNSGGSKRTPIHKKDIYYYDQPAEIEIQAYSLDEYFPNRDFDVIIMDIEGSEYFALKGMQRILSNSQVLAVEFLPHHLKNVSGVTAEEFAKVVQAHFPTLSIPSEKRLVISSDVLSTLSDMYKRNHEEDLILFLKNRQI